jgi:uncharacterized membrane protein YbhN (UPF0104 family)
LKYFKLIISLIIVAFTIGYYGINIKIFLDINIFDVFLLLIIGSACLILNALRIFLILNDQNLKINFLSCLKINMIGGLFDTILPTSNGGDLVRITYYIKYFNNNFKTKITSISILDRLIGFFIFFIFILLTGTLIHEKNNFIFEANNFFLFMTFIFICSLYVLGSSRIKIYLNKFRLTHRFRIIPIMETINIFRNSKKLLVKIFFITMINHFLIFLSLLIIFNIYNDLYEINFFIFIYSSSIGMISSILGVAGGFGIGTLTFIEIFNNLLPEMKNVAQVIILFQIYQLIIRLFGLPVYLMKKN